MSSKCCGFVLSQLDDSATESGACSFFAVLCRVLPDLTFMSSDGRRCGINRACHIELSGHSKQSVQQHSDCQ